MQFTASHVRPYLWPATGGRIIHCVKEHAASQVCALRLAHRTHVGRCHAIILAEVSVQANFLILFFLLFTLEVIRWLFQPSDGCFSHHLIPFVQITKHDKILKYDFGACNARSVCITLFRFVSKRLFDMIGMIVMCKKQRFEQLAGSSGCFSHCIFHDEDIENHIQRSRH